MKHLRLICLLIHILAIILIVDCEDENYFEDTANSKELVDPHSFYYDKQSKKMITHVQANTAKDILQESNEVKNELKPSIQADNYSSHEAVFYKRLINLLLSNIRVQDKDDISITGILEIEVSHSQMEVLQNFHIHKTSLREIDDILSNIIKKPRYNYMFGFMYVCDTLRQALGMLLKTIQEHQDGAIILFAMLMVCLTFRMIKWGQRVPIFSFIQIIFVLSFFMTWWQLIQEAEIKSTAARMKYLQVPISCQPDKMNMWDKFVSFFYNDCEQYYETIMSNPKLQITPAFALSHFITTVILHPITHVGTVISTFIHNATDNLPWAYGWIIRCILFLCVGFVIVTIPFCLSGASMNFGLGPLLRFGISYHKNSEKGNSLQSLEKRDPVQIILKLPQGTDVPQITNTSETEKSNALQVSKNCCEEVPAIDSDYQEYCDDLSCGDTIENIRSAKNDKNNEGSKKLDAVKTEKHDGSGDG